MYSSLFFFLVLVKRVFYFKKGDFYICCCSFICVKMLGREWWVLREGWGFRVGFLGIFFV